MAAKQSVVDNAHTTLLDDEELIRWADAISARLDGLPALDKLFRTREAELAKQEVNLAERQKNLEEQEYSLRRKEEDFLQAKATMARWERHNEELRSQEKALKRVLRECNLEWVWEQVGRAPENLASGQRK